MSIQRADAIGVSDGRRFHLLDYRHGDSQALVRSLPEPDEGDGDGGAPIRVIDFLFAGVVGGV
ncbi:hypothetical protein ACQP2P_26105 [Dactylosporangium sp. CA-139114]|uniref:hypothetical protein n=1 Tax=Dactylosporangium sp. CA-139114 TaxID=3239931 RepID=UPI003D98E6BD